MCCRTERMVAANPANTCVTALDADSNPLSTIEAVSNCIFGWMKSNLYCWPECFSSCSRMYLWPSSTLSRSSSSTQCACCHVSASTAVRRASSLLSCSSKLPRKPMGSELDSSSSSSLSSPSSPPSSDCEATGSGLLDFTPLQIESWVAVTSGALMQSDSDSDATKVAWVRFRGVLNSTHAAAGMRMQCRRADSGVGTSSRGPLADECDAADRGGDASAAQPWPRSGAPGTTSPKRRATARLQRSRLRVGGRGSSADPDGLQGDFSVVL
mmetsp:Transcript_74821/g.214323  ORF Transcript_74821/g.214323 Transcript_74821/m.214323 type:complete len:269 (-) Transcript_74821:193-999(-)